MNILQELKAYQKLLNNYSRENYFYNSIYDFFIQEGSYFNFRKITEKELEIINSAVSNLTFTPKLKECFYNAQMLCLNDTSENIKYIEGYVKIPNIGISIYHAWNIINNKVIDITYRLDSNLNISNSGNFILGNLNGYKYFGVELSKSKIQNYYENSSIAYSLVDDFHSDFYLLKEKYKL